MFISAPEFVSRTGKREKCACFLERMGDDARVVGKRYLDAMRLGFLLYEYFPFGGLQRDCLKSAQVCAGRGHEVTILTRTWRGERPSDVAVECFGRHGWNNYRRNVRWLEQLRNALPRYGFDAVIGFDKLPDLDVYFGADPCFLAKVERLKPFWYRWLRRYQQLAALERMVFEKGRSTQILQLTPWEIPIYKKTYGTEEERFHLLPANAVRREYDEPKRLAMRRLKREEQGWDPEDLLLILVGSDFRRKGLDRILQGIAALPDSWRKRCRLAVLGQCSPGRFTGMANRLGIGDRVHFLGGRMDAPD
jgi:UDP-glucose:(heptosyl)LPS alpha-1,3-glucosyltransferase